MITLRNLSWAGLTLAALLACGAASQAAWIGYKNDTPVVVVVQGSSQVGVGQPHQINSTHAAWDKVQPGVKTITITDPKTNKLLWKGPVTVGDKDLFFSIQVGKDGSIRMMPAALPPGMMPRK
jgi:pyruvate/2-oxoglutarate/acetoin dehydrogenase E1 component